MIRPTQPLPPVIRQLLSQLRRRIRWYVWLEGIAAILIWVCVTYWVGLALDYLPVWAGANEMPRAARMVLLLLIGTGVAYLLYRFIARRLFAQLPDRNLALLIERQFPQLEDALLTVVDNTDPRAIGFAPNDASESQSTGGTKDNVYERLLKSTTDLAIERSRGLNLGQILRWPALTRFIALALTLMASILGFAVAQPAAARLWTSRLFLLTDAPWPRRAYLEVMDFPNGQRKVAEGSNLIVRVRADANRTAPPPDVCAIDYQLASGQSGRANMIREGEPREGFQYYRYEGQPFQGMLETVTFDVFGLDARVSKQRVDVVPSPAIAEVQLDCEFPTYTQRPPRKQIWRSGTSLPAGSSVYATVRATKPLREANVRDLTTGEAKRIDVVLNTDEAKKSPSTAKQDSFSFALPPLTENQTIEIDLLDQDDVTSQQPYRIGIQVIEDVPPKVDVRLQGIGTAITPDAKLAVAGSVEDDYGIAKSWFRIIRQTGDDIASSQDFPLTVPRNGQLDAALDLRSLRGAAENSYQLQSGDKIVFSVRATDQCDLSGEPNEGHGDEWPLDVVSADELLALLEARELNLKRRFEQILVELTETRDSLGRLQANLTDSSETKTEPTANPDNSDGPVSPVEGGTAESTATESEPAIGSEQQSILKLLRVQRAQQQGTKSQQEVAGVAAAFADIREELINNRIDTPERRDRLQRDIIAPLDVIAADQFDRWLQGLNTLEQQVNLPTAPQLCGQSVQQTNELIFALQQVLEKMLELETYNELVDLVRSIVEEQNSLLEKTKEERKQQARSILED